MRKYNSLLSLVLLFGTVSCQPNKQVAPGSPTQSVEAAEAFNRGQALHESDKAGAVEEYSNAIDHDPNFAVAIYNRALANAGLAKDKEVLADLARLKELKADEADTLEQLLGFTPVVYSNQGQQALAENNFEFAVERFTAALLYAVDDPGILELRAQSYEKLGDMK